MASSSSSSPPTPPEIKSEERLIPLVRAKLAQRLFSEGFRVKEIASALNVTQAAVTQYLKGKRGGYFQNIGQLDAIIDPLAEKLVNRVRSGLGGLETVELVEAANQLRAMSSGRRVLRNTKVGEGNESMSLLRGRLRIELAASEKYLELANRANDDYLKLLLRMIASDSMRHADVVSQVISWLEAAHDPSYEVLSDRVLKEMLSIEDSANEASLKKSVEVEHPVARLLLEWIDIDEEKHERMVKRLTSLSR